MLYIKDMETIFDHKPTRDELKIILGYTPDKESYLDRPMDQDCEYGKIHGLYVNRKNDMTAQKYLRKIKDSQIRSDFSLIDVI